ncbi:MAG: Cys-Gln thioester bond-forming surface protein, partial [Oscillospiraceae bacterium]|nr:Cys-Gln thioester bond-forming surface protein [Oscillospiraceae bacterium]
ELVYMTDEEGNIIYEDGFPVVDMEKSKFIEGQNGKQTSDYGQSTGMVSQSVQFAIRHENGEFFFAYCMDASTGAGPTGNRWYNIRNLEDAIESEDNPDGYITAEEAAQIRAIATNGYWGTETGRGSVESLKELLKSVYNEDSQITVRYPGSNEPHVYDIYELIDGLTEHEALACTQAAIWTFANKDDITYRTNAGVALAEGGSVIGVLSAHKYQNSKGGWLNEYKPAEDGESDARLQALYRALLQLDPIYSDGELREDSTVIPNEGVVSDVAIVVKDKVEDDAANQDDNKDNDVFNTELNFKLAFVPGENDEMYVILMDAANQPILGEDGQPIKKLLASENSAKQGEDVIKPVDGVYTLTGLKVSENSDFQFDLRLEGTQYLNEGVYIYQAEGGRRESQTLVGLAKGEQKVEVSTMMTINFNVDENNNVVAERVWHEEDRNEYDVPTEEPVPFNFGHVVPRPLDNIPDEEVPLADAPQTGDEAAFFAILTVLAGISLMAMRVSEQKRKEEA